MRIVLDANVVASGICWRGEAHLCLVKLARRQAFAYGTDFTLWETRETVLRLVRELEPAHNTAGLLAWYLDRVRLVQAQSLGKQRSRDPKDDPYLAAALAAHASQLVTYDRDLLDLAKPFGIAIVRPAIFLKAIKG